MAPAQAAPCCHPAGRYPTPEGAAGRNLAEALLAAPRPKETP
jgi:hypothetical protein